MMREDRAHRLVDSAFAAEAEEPSESFERRVLRAIARERAGVGTLRQGGGRWLPRGFRSRSSMIALAACVAAAIGVTSTVAFAESGGLGDAGQHLLSAMGLRNAATGTRPVVGAATDAGLTVRATAAYRDHYLLVISTSVDGVANDRIGFSGYGAPPPTATTSAGQQLRLWGGAGGSKDGQTMVLARPDFSELTGADVTLTVHGVTRCEVHPMPNGPGGMRTSACGGPGYERTTSGTWAIRLHLPVQGSLARTLPAPAGQRLDGVQVGFHDLRSNGSYLFVDEDVSEETPGALSRALTFVPSDRKATSDPLWLTVHDSDGNEMPTLFQNSDAPGGKGSPAGPLTAGPYHWSYLFTLPGPGTYRLVVHGTGGDQLVRTIQVP
jgi:hypothetical protein